MGFLSVCFGFLLAISLVSVSAHPKDILRNVSNLEEKDFGHNYPRHGLNLLYWFSREYISFDNNNNMQPKKDPKTGAYGFHYYGNKENILPSIRNLKNYSYYVVGNLFEHKELLDENRLPDYVTDEFVSSSRFDSKDQNNRDRIIVRRTPYGSIDEVYITQHYNYESNHGSEYDQNNTYSIGSELVKEIRNMPREKFLEPFGPRTRNHYAKCHPDRQEHNLNQYCSHKFSKGSTLLALGPLVAMCYATFWLILGCS